MKKITPFLWFNDNGEEAMKFYTSVFKDSEIISSNILPDGKMMTGTLRLFDEEFMVINGGPQYKFTEAVSFYVDCKDQAEVDYYWDKLNAEGEESRCGWLKDKYGLSWQIIPKALGELMGDSDPKKSQAVMQAMLKMNKIIVADLQKAYDGK